MQNFVGREKEFEALRKIEADVRKGKSPTLLILGEKGIGKTTLIRRFIEELSESKKVTAIYIDLGQLNLSPDFFCLHFLGNVFHSLSEEKDEDKSLYFDLSFQKKIVQEIDPEIEAGLNKFCKELQGANWESLFLETFLFLEILAKRLDLRLILFLDNFSELSGLSNYQIEPFSIFSKSAGKTKRIGWVLASDRRKLLEGMFETLFLDGLKQAEARKLSLALLSSASFDDGAIERIYNLTEGSPSLIVLLTRELELKRRIDSFSVDEAFVLSFTKGAIYHYYKNMMSQKIAEARGEGLLRVVLSFLAKRGEATLSELSGDILRKSGVTRNLLLRLMDVDLVSQKEKRYYIPSRILTWWIRMYYYGILPELPEAEVIVNRGSRIADRGSISSIRDSQFAIPDSLEIADLLSSFSGQKIDGSLFGLKEEIVLPIFDKVKVVKHGKITEIEAIGDESWFVRSCQNLDVPVSEEQVEGLIEETKRRGYKGWFIGKQGFTYEAILKAEGKVYLSIDEDIKAIKKWMVNGVW
ncbi:ATP-binding protein [bacterium]|nr:ATP-binding protein [bacterium]